nr:sigma-70 family RNA polymerase sigma factor [candidate division Zixibacteria bacterium]
MNEKELVKLARGGDFDAFNRLIMDQQDKIYRLAIKVTGNREDAEDIVQETFIKAVDKIDRFRMESSFGTWLYAIALNSIRAHMGSRRQHTLKPLEDYLPGSHQNGSEALFDWGDPHKILEEKQLQAIIEDALADMPYKYSMPFILRYMEDMPIKEVARMSGLSLPAAKSRILRARLALRDKITRILKERKVEKL